MRLAPIRRWCRMIAGPSTTSPSLLAGLAEGPGNPSAWSEFVRVYFPYVVRWCREHGLQDADATDVAQEVLLWFWRKAAGFRYSAGGSFRAYLRRVVVSAVSDWAERRRADRLATGDSGVQDFIWSQPARLDLAARIEAAYDVELLAIAMREVRSRVHPRTWRAFEMLALEDRSGADVAAELGMEVNTAYVAKGKVQRMIRAVIDRLEAEGSES